jgi:hypothetical protein
MRLDKGNDPCASHRIAHCARPDDRDSIDSMRVDSIGIVSQAGTSSFDRVRVQNARSIHSLSESCDRRSFFNRNQAPSCFIRDEQKDSVRPDVDRRYSHQRWGFRGEPRGR